MYGLNPYIYKVNVDFSIKIQNTGRSVQNNKSIQNEAEILTGRREQLISGFLNRKEPNFVKNFAGILDEYFHSVFEKSCFAHKITRTGNPVALIALGGYGREEQCIHSDVDLLILFEKTIPNEAEEFIKELLYPLWDVHLETGYAVRSIKDCLSMAWQRFDILTTLLDARFICGGSHIYSLLMEEFRKKLSKKHQRKSLNQIIEHGRKRHLAFGDSTYLLEPNLKSGHGGLRDYHTLLWYAHITAGTRTRKDLEYYGFLSHDEYSDLEETLNFIWNIRNRLHYITGRKCDQLHFEHQIDVAKFLKFKGKSNRKGVEIFMGELHSRMDFLKQINQVITEDILLSKRIKKLMPFPKRTKVNGIEIKKRRLYFASTEMIPKHPDLLMKIFVESGRLKMPLSMEARRIVSEFTYLVDKKFRKDKNNVEAFEKIISYSLWEFNVLNVMHSTGLLKQFIPEFSLITNKIQYNQYHLFPVDKHSIRTVQIINSFKKEEFYSTIYREIRNKKILLIAALLHDIGKGNPSLEHSIRGGKIARTILKRYNYKTNEIDDIVFLIENHLLLVKIATRRDISCEETAIFCAGKIEKISRLRMLYLLTVADSMATGPKAWNDWTENLLRDLFLKTFGILKKGELATKKASRIIHEKKERIIAVKKDKWDESVLQKELDSMPPRYLLYVPEEQIIGHLTLYKKMGDKPFMWEIIRNGGSGIRTVVTCSINKPGLYSKIAGVFFLNNLNILGSHAYSWGNNMALNIFKVMPPEDKIFENEKWRKAEEEINIAINDDHFLDKLKTKIPKQIVLPSGMEARPNRVKIDNESSSFFTIIELFTVDFQGLLFSITNTLFEQGVDVSTAIISTKVDQVVDVFYVKSFEDEKIDNPETVENLKKIIIDSLPNVYNQLQDTITK